MNFKNTPVNSEVAVVTGRRARHANLSAKQAQGGAGLHPYA